MCTAEAAHNFLAKNIMPTDFESFIRFMESLTNVHSKSCSQFLGQKYYANRFWEFYKI